MVIQLGKKRRKFATIREQLQRRKELPLIPRILSDPKLTGGLAGGLIGGIPGALKGFLGAGLLTGLVSVSPKAEKFLKERIFKPEKAGERIGKFIEEPKRPFEKIIKRIKEKPLETTAVTAAGVGLVGAGVIGAKKILEKGKARITKDLEDPQLTPTAIPTGEWESSIS